MSQARAQEARANWEGALQTKDRAIAQLEEALAARQRTVEQLAGSRVSSPEKERRFPALYPGAGYTSSSPAATATSADLVALQSRLHASQTGVQKLATSLLPAGMPQPLGCPLTWLCPTLCCHAPFRARICAQRSRSARARVRAAGRTGG